MVLVDQRPVLRDEIEVFPRSTAIEPYEVEGQVARFELFGVAAEVALAQLNQGIEPEGLEDLDHLRGGRALDREIVDGVQARPVVLLVVRGDQHIEPRLVLIGIGEQFAVGLELLARVGERTGQERRRIAQPNLQDVARPHHPNQAVEQESGRFRPHPGFEQALAFVEELAADRQCF